MATVILDRRLAEQLREDRAATGSDRWDEVWEGTYMMAPMPNNEHQEIVGGFVELLREVFQGGRKHVYPGANVSDRQQGWEHNYRCPDVVVFLPGTSAKNCETHWCGGPDFAIEIRSDDDQTYEKIPFYAKIGTRELLIVDRNPWTLELFQREDGDLRSVGAATIENQLVLASDVLPLTFRLVAGDDRPSILATHLRDSKTWSV